MAQTATSQSASPLTATPQTAAEKLLSRKAGYDVEAGDIVVGEQAGLHLGGDPGVADGLVGIAHVAVGRRIVVVRYRGAAGEQQGEGSGGEAGVLDALVHGCTTSFVGGGCDSPGGSIDAA